jgi:HD-GYP domain-containing protein (c-di-GMP phosphodiesterase class II)
MPLHLPVPELRPGMKLHAPLTASGRVLLQAGKCLTASEIEGLQKRVPHTSVSIEDPILDGVIEFEDHGRDQKVASEVQSRVAQSMSEVQARFSARTSLQGQDYERLECAAHELMRYLMENPTTAASVMDCLDPQNHFATHTGNVFYLSMVLGSAALDYVVEERQRQTNVRNLSPHQAKDLSPLGLAAMVMDLGMIPLQQVVQKNQPLKEDESAAIRLHPATSFRMLPESFSAVARIIVRSHHENVAGCGYPMRLEGKRVHVFSRVVRIADAFSAATSQRAYRGAKSHPRALWEMSQGPYNGYYDRRLMAAFTAVIQPFPIGAKLKLKDGRYAVVVKHNREAPFGPTVIVAFDEEDRPIPRDKLQRPFSLATNENMRIAEFRGEDLSYVYQQEDSTPTSREQFSEPLEAMYP